MAQIQHKSVSIKKGDQVRVIAGNDKGVEGKVIEVLTEADRVIVEGVNRVKRHTRIGQGVVAPPPAASSPARPDPHLQRDALVEADGDKTTSRVGFRRDEVTKSRPDGTTYAAHRSVRIATKTGKEI